MCCSTRIVCSDCPGSDESMDESAELSSNYVAMHTADDSLEISSSSQAPLMPTKEGSQLS